MQLPSNEPSPRTTPTIIRPPVGDEDPAAAAAADSHQRPTTAALQTPIITEENEFGEPPQHKSSMSLHVDSAAAAMTGTEAAMGAVAVLEAAAVGAQQRRKLSVQVGAALKSILKCSINYDPPFHIYICNATRLY